MPVDGAPVPGLAFGPGGEGHLSFSFSVAEDMISGGVEAAGGDRQRGGARATVAGSCTKGMA